MKHVFLVVAAALITAVVMSVSASAAFAKEIHPPKFGVMEQQCLGTSNQPHCPGIH